MTSADLHAAYAGYLDCLNARDLDRLSAFVHEDVEYNNEMMGLSEYRRERGRDFQDIPALRFEAQMVVVEGETLASRLVFDCRPRASFLGREVNGRRVSFSENVIYEYERSFIRRVWSVIDLAALDAQLAAPVA